MRSGLTVATLLFATLSAAISAAQAESLEEIREAVRRSREAVRSLDVRVEYVNHDLASPEKKTGVAPRVERFAFKGQNRRIEQWNFDLERSPASHDITILGSHGHQRMTDGDFKAFGSRETCLEFAFSLAQYGHILRWAVHDPTNIEEFQRQMLTHHDLEIVLRNPKYRIVKTEGRLVTLQGDPNPPREAAEAVGAPIPDDAPTPTDTIVLDAEMSYAVRSWTITVDERPDCFYEHRNEDFKEVAPGAWLPQRGEAEEKGEKRHILTKWRVLDLTVNNVDDQVFEERLAPRSNFVDLDNGLRNPKTRGILGESIWDKAENFERSRGPNKILR
ncbi:MAG TPA: hypothetical protein VGN57_14045 [Pirellulaceae bacterium]|nr:hypothetical protein [Pirellulaceae bacterium]